MRYVNSSMTEGELVVVGPIAQTRWEYLSIWAVLVLPILFIWVRRWSTEYALTTRRLVTKTGLVARAGDELRLRKIESVQIEQGLFGRMLGYGDVLATGQGNQVVALKNVVDPMSVKRALEEAIDRSDSRPHAAAAA